MRGRRQRSGGLRWPGLHGDGIPHERGGFGIGSIRGTDRGIGRIEVDMDIERELRGHGQTVGRQLLTYNGSMVVMFPSQFATNYWVQTGSYYNAPKRRWAFDVNFLEFDKLPPATPMVRKLVRGQWNVVAAR